MACVTPQEIARDRRNTQAYPTLSGCLHHTEGIVMSHTFMYPKVVPVIRTPGSGTGHLPLAPRPASGTRRAA